MKNKAIIVLALCSMFLITVRAQELLDYPLDTIDGEEVYRYEVEKSIGLYRIGVNFKVSQSDIIRLNPQLRERGLHYKEIILLPTGRKIEEKKEPVEIIEPEKITVSEPENTAVTEPEKITVTEPENTAVSEPDSITVPEPENLTLIEQDSLEETDSDSLEPIDTIEAPANIAPRRIIFNPDTMGRKIVELALLLPFESQQTKRSGNAERMMEFYQGALLALHHLQNDSTLYRLRVYDSERSERRVQALCDSTELENVQGVLGLVYPIQIERMATWCAAHQVPLLVPFSDDIDLENHPYVLQFNASAKQEADSLCAWLESRKEEVNVVLTEVREADMSASIRTLRKQLKAHDISYTTLALRDLMNDSAAYAMDLEKENIILLHSDRYQQIRILLPHLATLRRVGHNISLVSQYAWQKEHIDLPQVYTSMFTQDGEREAYDSLWAQTYTGGHVSEHPRYDLLGYDLMSALVAWLQGEREYKGMQSAIQWEQVKEGGYQNKCVRVIAY